MEATKESFNRASRPSKSVAVVGAGISGLVAAYNLKAMGLKVTVFESEQYAGGKIRSRSADGLVWEEGANTMTENDPVVGRLLDDLKLRGKQQYPISPNKRYIARNGRPELIPANPAALIFSKILSSKSKLAVLLEPFASHNQKSSTSITPDLDMSESVGTFFKRHFGQEVVEYLIDPFLAGTSGGDPESLSMQLAFPEVWQLEKMYGSIILGFIKSKIAKRADKKSLSPDKQKQLHGSFSFTGGMQTLTQKLCTELDTSLKVHSKVLSLSCDLDENHLRGLWSLSYTTNSADIAKLDEAFDAVVMTAPLRNVKQMQITKNRIPYSLEFLPKVKYVPISAIVTAFKKEDVKQPLEGFGVLIPSKEQSNGLMTLGTLFSSMMFPDRAPGDQHLYTTFIGGTRNRDLAHASLDELQGVVTNDLKKLLKVEGKPISIKHIYWKEAFPLYDLNYGQVLDAIKKMEQDLPGLIIAGNHKDGLSVGKAIYSGFKAADCVTSYLESLEGKNQIQPQV